MDGDGYNSLDSCDLPSDCNDNDPAIHPGAEENCTDNIDNNCNGLVDCEEGPNVCFCCDMAAGVGASTPEFVAVKGETVTFSGSASSSKAFHWDFSIEGQGTSGSGQGNISFQYAWDGTDGSGNPLPAGVYTGRISATDDDGDCGTHDTVTVRILDPPCTANAPWGSSLNVASGEIRDSLSLFSTQGGAMPLHLALSFRNLSSVQGALGRGWSHAYDLRLVQDVDEKVTFRKGLSGRSYLYDADNDSYSSQSRDTSTLAKDASGFTLSELDGEVYRFDLAGRILSMSDRFGNQLLFDHATAGQLTVTDPLDRSITFYDDDGDSKVDRLAGPGGPEWSFGYDPASGRLHTVTAPPAKAGEPRAEWRYEYAV